MARYIQRKDNQFGTLETVDKCKTHREAVNLRNEYSLSDRSAYYYISSRACKAWREEEKS